VSAITAWLRSEKARADNKNQRQGVPTSHIRAVLSSEVVTIRRPSGLNCADVTAPSCSMGSPAAWPVVPSHSRAVKSLDAVTTHRPSGLNCADFTSAACRMGWPKACPVAASHSRRGGEHASSIRAELRPYHPAFVLHRFTHGLSRRRVPQPRRELT
jgi:hypothetical protein